MIHDLVTYISNIKDRIIKRDDLMDSLDLIYNDIELNIMPMIDSINIKLKKSNVNTDKIEFFRNVSISNNRKFSDEFRNTEEVVYRISSLMRNILDSRMKLTAYLKDIPKNISTVGISANQALVLNILDNLQFFSNVSADILIVILENICDVDSDDSLYSSKVLRNKKYLLFDWYNILTTYDDFDKVIVDLGSITITNDNGDMIESLAKNPAMAVSRLSSKKDFSGNPIYHFQLFLIDKRKDKIKVIEKKKAYVEVLLSELELGDVYDPDIDRQVENAKELINKYELELEKLSS